MDVKQNKKANRNSPKKSPSKKNVPKKNTKAEDEDKTSIDQEDMTLNEVYVNPNHNEAVVTLEEKAEVDHM